MPADEDDEFAFRVQPAKYSPYIAVQLKPSSLKEEFKGSFGPLRYNLEDLSDENRKFWVPLHKLFEGDECIKGLSLTITLKANHVNEKLKRIHIELEKNPRYPKMESDKLNSPPYRFTEGIADFSKTEEYPDNLLIPVPHKSLVEVAQVNGKLSTFLVPQDKTNPWAPSYLIPSSGNFRHAPEYVHVRHQHMGNEKIDDLNEAPSVIEKVRNGGYNAVHYIDYTGDGWIEASCPEIYAEFPRPTIPAYSLVTSPDFFPLVDQGDIMNWYIHSVPSPLIDPNWFEPGGDNLLKTLSDERFAPNIELNRDPMTGEVNKRYPFRKDDDTITAIIALPLSERQSALMRGQRLSSIEYTYLPDAASGVYAPGWDISLDYSDGIAHFAALRFGKSFSRRCKIMRCIESFWPAVSPDAGRTFWWSQPRDGTYPTISPLMDNEIHYNNNGHPWDGYDGPRLIDQSTVEYFKAEAVDYVNSALNNKFTLKQTHKVTSIEYKERILAVAKAFAALSTLSSIPAQSLKTMWLVISFRKLLVIDDDVKSAQRNTRGVLSGSVYRTEIVRGQSQNSSSDFKKMLIKVRERYVFLTCNDPNVYFKHDDSEWKKQPII